MNRGPTNRTPSLAIAVAQSSLVLPSPPQSSPPPSSRALPSLALAALVLSTLALPATARAEAAAHSGFFGGATYGHFAYEDGRGGTEPGWGPTFGAFGELTPFPADILLLTIEGSYLRIGSGDQHYYYPAETSDLQGTVRTAEDGSRPALRESRAFLSAAPLIKLTTPGRLGLYAHAGPTLNFRLPEGTSYPGALVLGSLYGLGLGALEGRRSFMVELRYVHHWSSSADDWSPPSQARALTLIGKIGY